MALPDDHAPHSSSARAHARASREAAQVRGALHAPSRAASGRRAFACCRGTGLLPQANGCCEGRFGAHERSFPVEKGSMTAHRLSRTASACSSRLRSAICPAGKEYEREWLRS